MNEELSPKEATEDLDGKEERLAASDPSRVIEAEPAAGYYAMDMRMKMEILPPCVQDS